MSKKPGVVPDTDDFRKWVRMGLDALEARPTEVAFALGLGKNAIQQFLKDDSRGINLQTARRIEVELRTRAARQAVALEPLGNGAGGGHV